MSEETLAEFEAWCKGKGRGGNQAGWHGNTLDHIASFRMFKRIQRLKHKEHEKRGDVKVDDEDE